MYELTLGIINIRLEAISNEEVNKNVDLISIATDLYLSLCELQMLKNRAHRIDSRSKFLRNKLWIRKN